MKAIAVPARLRHRFIRFLLVGALNTTFGYLVYACLLRVGVPYAIASFGSLSLGILFSFRTQGTLVFDNHDRRLIVRFTICWIAIYLVNILAIGAMTRIGLDPYLSGALAMVPTAVLSYLTQKFLVFRTAGAQSAADS